MEVVNQLSHFCLFELHFTLLYDRLGIESVQLKMMFFISESLSHCFSLTLSLPPTLSYLLFPYAMVQELTWVKPIESSICKQRHTSTQGHKQLSERYLTMDNFQEIKFKFLNLHMYTYLKFTLLRISYIKKISFCLLS